MKTPRPSPSRSTRSAWVALALVAYALPATRGQAQTTATTDPVGYTSLPLLANSDTLVSIPFTRPASFTGTVSSVAGNTVTAASSGFAANQYQYAPVSGQENNTYYMIIGPNIASLNGTVTVTNGSTTVTGSGTTFTSQVAVNDEILVNGLAYNVSAITSDTALTLARAFTGTTATGVSATYDHSPKEGSFYTVTANGTNTLTVNLNGDSLAAVAAGTSISVIPYWTLGTAFPAGASSFTPSTGPTSRGFQTQILLPDLTSPGINLSASAIYFNYNGAWRLAGSDPTVSYDDTILLPSSYFTVRNGSAPTTFTPAGGVYMNRLTVPLDTQVSSQQDNAVAVLRPVPITLNDLGLVSSGAFAPSTGPTSRFRTDSLLTYDNTTAGVNKSSNAIYYFYGGAWRLSGGDPTVDYGTTPIPYGTGFTIRKGAATGGTTSFWQNTRTY